MMAKRRRIELSNDLDYEITRSYDFFPNSVEDIQSKTKKKSYGLDSGINIEMYVKTFNFKLRKWAVENNISLMATTALLKLLQEEGHTSLPKDARTLLETPKNVIVSKIGKGEFWYRSLIDKLKDICKRKKCPKHLEIGIHIDGMQPYRSSNIEFWPIQCWIKEVLVKPFIVGLHLGRSKPSCVKTFLRPLLDDLHHLLANGIDCEINGKVSHFTVDVQFMIFDAPARSLLKFIKSHSGYFSCERCTEEGVYLLKSGEKEKKKAAVTFKTAVNKKKVAKKNVGIRGGHVCLIGTDAPLRTDKTFREQQQEEHHTGKTPLEELPKDMIAFFPLEYMHLILLGDMKKLLHFWVDGTYNYKTKFSALDISQISEQLVKAGETKPAEINRPSRSLSCLSNWKATEFRTFLLKTGPVVLKNHLSEEAYNHFLALHCATTICCSESLLPFKNVARYLFKEFVDNFGEIYGFENYSYVVHSTVHIVDDVEKYGVLDNFSAFKGESNLASIKRMLRSGYKPLQQIVKRIYEKEAVEMIEDTIPPRLGLHKDILTLKNLRLDSSEKNRWILTKDNFIFMIKKFSQVDTKIQIHGTLIDKKYQTNLFDKPIESSKLSIYCSKLIEKEDAIIDLDQMHCKLFKIQVSADEFAFFPLSHYTK